MGRPPTRYGGLTDAELAAALADWFAKHGERSDAWSRTVTGRQIKRALVALGRFKHRPRGDPAAGRKAMLERRRAQGLGDPAAPPDAS